jgi:hypothetical protein
MFLVIFDDPRPACNVHTHGKAPQSHLNPSNKSKGKGKSNDRYVDDNFPWEEEYKLRIWAESFIFKRTRPPLSGSHDAPFDSTDDDLYIILETLLRVVMTAAPLPYHALTGIESPCQALCLPHPHPIFSPIVIAAHSQPGRIPDSRNTRWLARVFEHGLPHVLMARLTAFDENGDVDVQKDSVKWDGLLAKLVAQVGLMIPIGDSDHRDAEQGGGNTRHVTPNSEAGEGGDEVPCTSSMTSVTTSPEDVRRLARIRVYNMAYPEPSRIFGPFLPLETDHEMPVDNTMGLAIAAPPVPAIPDTTSFLTAVAGAVDSDRGETSAVGSAAGGSTTSQVLYCVSSNGPYLLPSSSLSPRFSLIPQ